MRKKKRLKSIVESMRKIVDKILDKVGEIRKNKKYV